MNAMARPGGGVTAFDLHYETESAERDKTYRTGWPLNARSTLFPTKYRMQPGQGRRPDAAPCRAHAARDAHMWSLR